VKQVDFFQGLSVSPQRPRSPPIEMEVPDIGHLRVIHPMMCWTAASRISTCARERTVLESPRRGSQWMFARAFIRQEVATGGERGASSCLSAVADIAGDMAAVRVFLLFGIDPWKPFHSRLPPPPRLCTRSLRKSLRMSAEKGRCESFLPFIKPAK